MGNWTNYLAFISLLLKSYQFYQPKIRLRSYSFSMVIPFPVLLKDGLVAHFSE